VTLVTDAFFENAAPPVRLDGDPLTVLASRSKQSFQAGSSPLARGSSTSSSVPRRREGSAPSVTQEAYENRLFVLTAMSEQDFYERYRSVKNDALFFERAEEKLGLKEIRVCCASPTPCRAAISFCPDTSSSGTPQRVRAGDLRTRDPLPDPSAGADRLHPPHGPCDLQRLNSSERDAIAAQRVPEIAQHFGSSVGVVGDRATFQAFFALFARTSRSEPRSSPGSRASNRSKP